MRDVRPLGMRIHAWLRAAILDVAIKPGASIFESDIAARFASSRTPVREALLKLAAEELVEIVPQRGTYVARMSLPRIEEALFIREAIESAVLARVIAGADRKTVAKALQAIVGDQAAALAVRDTPRALEADARFHRVLVEASGLPGVWAVLEQARETHHRIRAIAVPELRSGRRAVDDHKAIIRAVAAGDAVAAARAMGEHLSRNLTLARGIAALHPDYFMAPPAATDGDKT